ncbi:MAG: exonuclease domain-containing protein [Rhodovibrionaceae bacterium]|nr:exonuclease domain-containing protein [Rhodovibrionaceae bacterium]
MSSEEERRGNDTADGQADGARGPTGTRFKALILSMLALSALASIALVAVLTLTATGILAATQLLWIAAAALAVIAAGALIAAAKTTDELFRALERLRGAMVVLTGSENAVPPRREAGEEGLEVDRLHWALSGLAARYARERAVPDERMRAVLGAISEGVVVVTQAGQVSLVNQAAMQLLGAERVKVGTSVFAALERESLTQAMERAEAEGRRVEAGLKTLDGETVDAIVSSFGKHGGAVICFSAEEMAEHGAEIYHDLALHDRPPPAGEIHPDRRLDELPMLVLDTETTGLDVTRERVISIGAVRLHGPRAYPAHSMDRLINPGTSIPPRSTVIHGITDEMVADAQSFPEVYAELRELLEGCVLVGHNIAFDQAMLRRECELAGLDWPEPTLLDTLLLAGALDPSMTDLRLEGLAAAFGVDIHGRHTALGDCLVTAEILTRMLPRLEDIGVVTLADAQTHGEQAKHLVRAQKDSGW